MTEELLEETAYRRADDSGQKSLITAYCGDIEQRIVSALTADEAKVISEEACRTFRKECASTLVGKALTDHVAGLYERYWGKDSSFLHSTLGVGRSALDISFLGDKR